MFYSPGVSTLEVSSGRACPGGLRGKGCSDRVLEAWGCGSLRGAEFADCRPHPPFHFQQQSSKRSDCAHLFSMSCSEPLWLSFCPSQPPHFRCLCSDQPSPSVLWAPSFSPRREQLKCHTFGDLPLDLKYLHCPPPLTDLSPGHSQSLACSAEVTAQAWKPHLGSNPATVAWASGLTFQEFNSAPVL